MSEGRYRVVGQGQGAEVSIPYPYPWVQPPGPWGPFNNEPRTGWVCPRCWRVYAPDQPQCWLCNCNPQPPSGGGVAPLTVGEGVAPLTVDPSPMTTWPPQPPAAVEAAEVVKPATAVTLLGAEPIATGEWIRVVTAGRIVWCCVDDGSTITVGKQWKRWKP